jgi:hypothetical protein
MNAIFTISAFRTFLHGGIPLTDANYGEQLLDTVFAREILYISKSSDYSLIIRLTALFYS